MVKYESPTIEAVGGESPEGIPFIFEFWFFEVYEMVWVWRFIWSKIPPPPYGA